MNELTAAVARLLRHREWAAAARRFAGRDTELRAETERTSAH